MSKIPAEIALYDGTNYESWLKDVMRHLLVHKDDLWDYVSGAKKRPNIDAPDFDAADEADDNEDEQDADQSRYDGERQKTGLKIGATFELRVCEPRGKIHDIRQLHKLRRLKAKRAEPKPPIGAIHQ